jgi:hypothetical protein
MRVRWGYVPFAVVNPNPKAVRDIMIRMRDDPHYYRLYKRLGRTHYERYHHPAQVAKKLIGLYEEALENG